MLHATEYAFALLVHGLPVALEYVLLMTLEYEVHITEYVWPSWSSG